MTIYIDTGDGYPPGEDIAAAGVAGVIGYVGTPGRRKNLTGAVVADYRAHGVAVLAVYEDTANDVAGGHGAGVAHAQAALADMRAMGLPDTTPLCAAADEHLTAGIIPTATAYQAGFHDTAKAGWSGPVGGYGFSEYLAAIRASHVADWTWQAGTHPAPGSEVNMWQRNGSNGQPTQMSIGGITVDIDDLLTPIQEADMNLTDQVPVPVLDASGDYTGDQKDGNGQPVTVDVADLLRFTNVAGWWLVGQVKTMGASIAALQAAVGALAAAASSPVTAEQLTAIVDAAVAQHIQVTGTVQVGPAPATPPAPTA